MAVARSLRCRAVTLVEVLVVMGILGLLLGLVLPAVQSAREAARLAHCGSNLRQIGIAVQLRHEARGLLPTTVTSGKVDIWNAFDPRAGTSHSWIVQLLPYLDEQSLYQRFDLTQGLFRPGGGSGSGPEAERPAILVCPSDDGGGGHFSDPSLTAGRPCGRGNYAAWASPFHVEYQHLYPAVLGWRERPRLADVTDGLQATLMVSELRVGRQAGDARGAWAVGWNGASVLAFDMHHDGEDGGPFRHAAMSLGHTQRPNISAAEVNVDMLYACPDPRGTAWAGMPCGIFRPFGPWYFLSSAPRSRHRGGVQALWADGRVTFLEDGIDEVTMAYLIAIRDGRRTSLPGP